MTAARPFRLAWCATHPIQYQAPLLRALAARPELELTALFFSDFSTRDYCDKEFGRVIRWDVPLVEGYAHQFLDGTGREAEGTDFLTPRVRGLGNWLRPEQFDGVLVQGWSHYAYLEAAWRAHRAGLKVFLRCEATDHITALDPPPSGLKARAKKALREAMVRALLSRIDCACAIGQQNRAFYRRRGVEDARLGSMPYCVDTETFSKRAADSDPQALRAELHLPPDVPVLLYASKLTQRKNADLLLQACSDLCQQQKTPLALVIVGDGELRDTLEAQAARLPATSPLLVRFAGFRNQSELPAYYALADIFALPSVRETWGLVVNEAMAAGCAILATDQVGSAADLVRTGVNGAVIPTVGRGREQMTHDLHQAIADCLENQRYRVMGEASRQIIAHWGIAENVEGLLSAIEKTRSRPR